MCRTLVSRFSRIQFWVRSTMSWAIAVPSFVWSGVAQASVGAVGDEIKAALFRDCAEARKVMGEISPGEEVDTYHYLVRVLTLNTEAPDVPEAFLPAAGAGHGASFSWQSVDARRELSAKRCALDLLESAGSRAASALTELAGVYSEQQLSDELAVRIEEVSADIAASAHTEGILISNPEIDILIGHLGDSHPLVARNLLVEYSELSIRRLVKALLKPGTIDNEKSAAIITSVLREIDPGNSRTFATFLFLAPTLTPNEIQRGVNRISFPRRHSLIEPFVEKTPIPPYSLAVQGSEDDGSSSLLVDEIAKLAASPSPEVSVPFARLLGRACLVLGTLWLPAEMTAALGERSYLSLIHPDSMPVEAQRCLVRSIPELKADVRSMILYGNDLETELGLQFLPLTLSHFSQKDRSLLFARLRDLTSDRANPNFLLALSTLTVFTERTEEVVKFYTGNLKAARAQTSAGEQLRRAILEGLSRDSFASKVAKFSSELVDWLVAGFEVVEISDLISDNVPAFESHLLSAWKGATTEVRRNILNILSRAPVVSVKTLRIIADGYSSAELRGEIEKIFRQQSNQIPNPLVSIQRRIQGTSRVETLSLLVEFRLATTRESSELVNALVKASCPSLELASNAVEFLLRDEHLSDSNKSGLFMRLAACLPDISPGLASKWVQDVPFEYFGAIPVRDSRISVSDAFQPVLETLLASATERQDTAWYVVIERALSQAESGLQTVVLQKLSNAKGDLPSTTITALIQLIGRLDPNDVRRALALEILAERHKGDYDWRAFVRSLIEQSGRNELNQRYLRIVQKLPSKIVLDEVLAALQADEPEKIMGAARVGALLGKRGFSLVPALWELRMNNAPAVRYSAVLALLEINPLTPDLHEYVARLLVNRFFPLALGRPIEWQQTAAVAVLNKRGNGYLRESRLDWLARNETEM